VLLSPNTSVWGLPASVAESVTVRHVRGYRGFVRFGPYGIAWKFPTVGGPCAVDARVWVWQISDDVTLLCCGDRDFTGPTERQSAPILER
jgi:hypothetical protein